MTIAKCPFVMKARNLESYCSDWSEAKKSVAKCCIKTIIDAIPRIPSRKATLSVGGWLDVFKKVLIPYVTNNVKDEAQEL
jgi:hypothetical protein